MHFEATISLGNIIAVGSILYAIIRYDRKHTKHDTEHEILLTDYCKRKGLRLSDLPTRTNSAVGL